MTAKEIIARRAAKELNDADVVNLGIGLPTLVADYLPDNIEITLQSENGILDMAGASKAGDENHNVINAGGQYVDIKQGASFFDSCMSFGIIRGGHVDVTILGALQVDETGTLASHIVPGQRVSGMGGAMDLVVGARKVIVATTHTAKGIAKLVKQVNLPPTAVHKVNLIITELGVIEVTKNGFLLKEISPEITVKEIMDLTDAPLVISKDLRIMDLD